MSIPADAWAPWAPEEVARVLHDVDADWCIAGGWALELWDSRLARPHGDIEIVVPRSQFEPLRRKLEQRFQLYATGSGKQTLLHPTDCFPGDINQCWVRAEGKWRLDVMLDPSNEACWVFRRAPQVSVPRARVVCCSASGLRYLAPEVVLLFKGKGDRAKDQTDFETALPILDRAARIWLADALMQWSPDHPWIARLRG